MFGIPCSSTNSECAASSTASLLRSRRAALPSTARPAGFWAGLWAGLWVGLWAGSWAVSWGEESTWSFRPGEATQRPRAVGTPDTGVPQIGYDRVARIRHDLDGYGRYWRESRGGHTHLSPTRPTYDSRTRP